MHNKNMTLILIVYFAGLAALIGGLSSSGMQIVREDLQVTMVAF